MKRHTQNQEASEQVRWMTYSTGEIYSNMTEEDREKSSVNNPNRCQNNNKRCMTSVRRTSTSFLPLAVFSLSLFLSSYSEGYQLTNNLIANNLPPKFITSSTVGQPSSNSEIVVRVKEGPASIGKLIYTLKAEDPDEDPLTFGVLGSMASDLLRIENVPENQANVYLRKELDRETTESYQVVITLTDGKLGRGNWITKSMLIIVEDVNDNFPIFGPHRTSISVREDSKWPLVIETLEATDQDEGRFGQVIYKLDDQSDEGKTSSISDVFAVETADGKGVISLIGKLDFEQKSLYQLRILAVDRATESERLTTSTSILISVEDCEDQPPMFTFVPSITRIPENLPIGSNVVRVTAIDGDRGVNNPIQYSLVSVNGHESGSEKSLFSLDPQTGQIRVAHELDRERGSSVDFWDSDLTAARPGSKNPIDSQPGSFVLQIRASEIQSNSVTKSESETSVTTELTIILTDVNDEAPTFSRPIFYGEILENSVSDSLVTFINFNPTHSGTSMSQNQPESANLAFAKVIDRDQGTNGTFTLRLEGQHAHLFTIWPREATNEANLVIKVAGGSNSASESKESSNSQTISNWLDYEKHKQFQFDIIAREKFSSAGKPAEHSASMTVFIKDANDNYPQFESDLYTVDIPENAIRGMHICIVKANDADSGIYGSQGIRYTELRGEKANKFKLDPSTGVITLKTSDHGFDRESVAQYTLIIEARDSNGLGNRNTTQLLITITDVNDQRPKFALDQYEAFIYENELEFQSPPLQVQAIDGDAPNTPNSLVTYSIVGGDPQQNFTIDPQTGRIRIRNTLVSTNSSNPRSINANIINDMDNSYGFDLSSNESVPLTVAQTSGLDFESIAQKRDEARQFNLTIKATDSGIPEPLSGITQVIIVVYDKNDHAPIFTRSIYSKSIREDAREGSQILQVLALDGDHSPANSKVTYRISSGASDKFVIDADSGLISVATGANLDIDRIANQKRNNYLLSVLAMDGSFGPNQKSASCLVNISIIDINNKPPEFISLGASLKLPTPGLAQIGSLSSQQLQVVSINEDAPYGLIVTRVFASDPDATAELRYSINYSRSEARNEEMMLVEPSLYRDIFTIEPIDGTIKVGKQLDRELFDQVKLRLQVEDIAAETSGQVSYSYLTVKITDVNDNRPTFKQPVYKAVVNENSISGTSIITITADDRDLNKTLKYSLDGQPDMLRLVRINPRSGEITVNDKIDRESYSFINVTVRAEDFGHPHSLAGLSHLLITVRDENDNNPIFLNHSKTPPMSTNNLDPVRTKLSSNHRLSGFDIETLGTGASSNRFRSLVAPELAPNTETMAQLAGSKGVTNVLPFLAPGATAKIREDSPIGFQIAYVRAEDADIDNNGRVTYIMDPASSGGRFRIDRDSGIISVAGLLDREQTKLHSLIIEACDNYDLGYSTGESRRTFTQVNILITDVNDNAPTINTNMQPHNSLSRRADELEGYRLASYLSHDDIMLSPGPYETPMQDCLFISEFQTPNEPILTVTATDPDDPSLENGKVDLAIVNNPNPLPENALFGLIPISWTSGSSKQPIGVTSDRSAPVIQNLGVDSTVSPPSSVLDNGSSVMAVDSNETEIANDPFTASNPTGHGEATGELSPNDARSRSRLKRSDVPVYQSIRHSPRGSSTVASIFHSLEEPGSSVRLDSVPSRVPETSPDLESTKLEPLTSRTSNYQPQSAVSGQSVEVGEQQAYLVVLQSLKEKVGNYSILIRATDRGHPALSSTRRINICVQDVNNHAPVFHRPPLNHTIRVLENATIGTFVAQVEATDSDHGVNGELQYSFKATLSPNNNNDWQAFKIDRLTGVISTSKLFNRQFKKYYTLRVQAQDFGRPTSLSSDMDINIMIVNSGQYQPEFENQLQTVSFTENVSPGIEWITVIPTSNLDDDPALINANENKKPASGASGTNHNWPQSTPCYFIVDGDDHEQVFHLDRYTHRLTNQKLIDREKKANYTLVIQATNNCQHPTSIGSSIFSRSLSDINEQTEPSSNSRTAKGLLQPSNTSESSSRERRSFTTTSIKRQLISPNSSTLGAIDTLTSKLSLSSSRTGKLIEQVNNFDSSIASDKSLLKLFIRINDINDNAPKFTQKVYTGGITTEADFGTVFMIVQAIDPDADSNGQVSYSIVRPIKRHHSNGLPSESRQYQKSANIRQKRAPETTTIKPSSSFSTAIGLDDRSMGNNITSGNELTSDNAENDDLFAINSQTGEISLNFDPQKHMKGYFEFEIVANDTEGLFDSSMVYIYLLRQDQRVKFILRLTPQELRQRLDKFRSVLGNITGAIVNIDSYKYYENHDGTVDKKKTSLYLHFVNPDDNTIIDVDKVLTLIDNNIEYLDELYKEFHVLSSEAAHLPLIGSALIDPIDQVRTGLMGVSSFLGLILILVVALCLNQRTRYERQLKAATVSAFNGSPMHLDPEYHRQTNLPNTNLHSQDPNPIWMNGFAIEHHNDWLHQSGASGAAKGIKGKPIEESNSPTSQNPRGHSNNITGFGLNIETDADYLSSHSGGANSCDMSSLNGHQLNLHHHHHYNGATTATPRTDSLNSNSNCDDSAGSGTNSNSGSASTTNERQALCHRGRNQAQGQQVQTKGANISAKVKPQMINGAKKTQTSATSASVTCPASAAAATTTTSTTTLLNGGIDKGALKGQRLQQIEDQNGEPESGNTIGHHSTFGAFKEVTIYTDNHHHQSTGASNLVRLVSQPSNNSPVTQRQQQQQTRSIQKTAGQVNKIASQFNAKHLAQTRGQSKIYISGQSDCDPGGVLRSPQLPHKVIVHPNGADINHGIIASRLHPDTPNGRSGQQVKNLDDNNFEDNLSKLRILKLETTEL